MGKINILFIDDNELFREGVKQVLREEPIFNIITSSYYNINAVSFIQKYKIHIVLMDINSRNANEQILIEQIIHSFSNIKVIIFSFRDEKKMVLESLRKGVHGYILKNVDGRSMIEAIKSVFNNYTYLDPNITDYVVDDYQRLVEQENTAMFRKEFKKPLHILSRRECEVLQLLAEGCNNESIAQQLGISKSTCKNHINSIFKKMNVNTRTLAVVTAIKNSWVRLEIDNNS